MPNKKKIIILTYYDFPCHHPVLENVFAKELGKYHDIIWLFQGDVSRGTIYKWHNSQVLLSKKVKGDNLFSKSLNQILKWHKIFNLLKLLREGEVKFVLVRDLPLESLLVGFLKLFFNFKLYFQYSAPQGGINIEYSKKTKGIKRGWFFLKGHFFDFLIKRALKNSNLIFPITEFHKKELCKYIDENKMFPITMGVDRDWLSKKLVKVELLEQIKTGNVILVYFGSLSFVRNPQFILESFSLVKKGFVHCKLLLIGKTAHPQEQKELEILSRKFGIEKDVIFAGYINKDKLRDYLAYCDVSISAIPVEDHYKISSPTKVYESLGCGVPVVANKGIDEQESVISLSNGGIAVDYSPESFCDAILELIRDTNLRNKMSRNGREYVIANYSYRKIAEKISPFFC